MEIALKLTSPAAFVVGIEALELGRLDRSWIRSVKSDKLQPAAIGDTNAVGSYRETLERNNRTKLSFIR